MEYIIQDSTLQGIADAIRGKTGSSDPIPTSAFAEAIAAIEAGGGDSAEPIACKAFGDVEGFESDMLVAGHKVYKRVVPLPQEFEYSYGYTNTSADLTLTLNNPAAENDTVLAIFAIRGYTSAPNVPDGWELVHWVPPTESDKSSLQSIFCVKKSAQTNETVSITFSQKKSTNRLYGILMNLSDAEVGVGSTSDTTIVKVDGGGELICAPLIHEHAIYIYTCTLTQDDRYGRVSCYNLNQFWQTSCSYSDDSAVNSRLCAFYVPWKSERDEETLDIGLLDTYGNPYSTLTLSTASVLQIQITPKTWNRWAYA